MKGWLDKQRGLMGMVIVLSSLLGILIASAIAILAASSADRPEMARLVFTATLPVLGTWVGTVLAFYFARENMQTATETTLRLNEQLVDPGTPVRDAMIKRAEMVVGQFAPGRGAESVALRDLHQIMVDRIFRRVPVLDTNGAVVCVVHDSTLGRYAADQNTSPDQLTQTLSDLLGVPELGALVKAIGFVTPAVRVADARQAMGAIKDCNDVFVTATGNNLEAVEGWLTNTLLASIK